MNAMPWSNACVLIVLMLGVFYCFAIALKKSK
jgi:hypothetical protein